MPDFYEILGVDAHAPADFIHAAYRRQSKIAHPDGGGTQEQFELLKLAHDVLTDPYRRARYDETGEYDETKAANELASILEMVTVAFDEAVRNVLESNGDFERIDLVGMMRAVLDKQAQITRQQINEFAKAISLLNMVEKRFRRHSEGENYLKTLICEKQRLARESMTKAEERIVVLTRARDFLKDYRYEFIPADSYGIQGFQDQLARQLYGIGLGPVG